MFLKKEKRPYMIMKAGNSGWINISGNDIPAELRNKRIIMEDLDDEGNVIQRTILDEEDKDDVLAVVTAKRGYISISNEKELLQFTEEQKDIINEILEREDMFLSKKQTIFFKNLFKKNSLEKIQYALNLMQENWAFNTAMNSPYYAKKFSTFEEALDFINERDGIYYAMKKDGTKHLDFIDKPTKKQAVYQRVKHGNQIVFLSFADFKIYVVSEDELR
ncbi:hypothetical protein [Bacillus cereus group sp. BY6-1LC]|uniref:hypothetical protein n=1 Tax=Bacillus cereus group sp. BY6-1LC TaxID=3018077 RepID=UPI0022E0615A|nr:hypothetical protein [Bacillus cereus group sp. BY6-1LC]MDA1799457.1 hypothetical protein [Bacillus cereus group sp. BY6-1LC]